MFEDRYIAVAMAFHNVYEDLAVDYSWNTQQDCKVPWEGLPANNRHLMVATIAKLVHHGIIKIPTRINADGEILPAWEKPAFP